MININHTVLFKATKNGKNSTEEEVKYSLERETYNIFLDNKKNNNVFTLATVCVIPFKSLLMTLKYAFDYITLSISSDGIRIENTSANNKNEIVGLSYFMGICGFGDNLPIIKWDRCEKYECCVNSHIIVDLKTSDLDIVIKHITNESLVYLFINKNNYNSETGQASSIEFHIEEEKCKKNTHVKEFGYNEIIIPCKQKLDSNHKIY